MSLISPAALGPSTHAHRQEGRAMVRATFPSARPASLLVAGGAIHQRSERSKLARVATFRGAPNRPPGFLGTERRPVADGPIQEERDPADADLRPACPDHLRRCRSVPQSTSDGQVAPDVRGLGLDALPRRSSLRPSRRTGTGSASDPHDAAGIESLGSAVTQERGCMKKPSTLCRRRRKCPGAPSRPEMPSHAIGSATASQRPGLRPRPCSARKELARVRCSRRLEVGDERNRAE